VGTGPCSIGVWGWPPHSTRIDHMATTADDCTPGQSSDIVFQRDDGQLGNGRNM